jgi:hypothetical protein
MRVNIRGRDQDRKGRRLEKISPARDPMKVEQSTLRLIQNSSSCFAGIGQRPKEASLLNPAMMRGPTPRTTTTVASLASRSLLSGSGKRVLSQGLHFTPCAKNLGPRFVIARESTLHPEHFVTPTSQHYVDKKKRVFSGLGHLLAAEPGGKITELNQITESTKRPAKRKRAPESITSRGHLGRKRSPVRGVSTRGSTSIGWLPSGRLAHRVGQEHPGIRIPANRMLFEPRSRPSGLGQLRSRFLIRVNRQDRVYCGRLLPIPPL